MNSLGFILKNTPDHIYLDSQVMVIEEMMTNWLIRIWYVPDLPPKQEASLRDGHRSSLRRLPGPLKAFWLLFYLTTPLKLLELLAYTLPKLSISLCSHLIWLFNSMGPLFPSWKTISSWLPHSHTLGKSCYTSCLCFLTSHCCFRTLTQGCQHNFHQGLFWSKAISQFPILILSHLALLETWSFLLITPTSPGFLPILWLFLSLLYQASNYWTVTEVCPWPFFVFKVFINLVICLTYTRR